MANTRYLAVTDFETTGLDQNTHEIIQISRKTVDLVDRCVVPGSELNVYVYPVNWEVRSAKAMEINNISREFLEEHAVSLEDALRSYCCGVDWSQSAVAAWGTDFEMKFLYAACDRVHRVPPFSYKSVDVRSIAFAPMIKQGDLEYRGLSDAADWYGITVDSKRIHDAAYDVKLTCDVLLEALR